MSKKIDLQQLKNFRGMLMVIEDEVDGAEGKKEKKISPATVKDSIEGFLIFLNMSFRTAMTMEDWKLINRINKRILDAEGKNILVLEDSEHDWLKKKLEAVPPQSALQQGASTVDSYGGLAFGADVIPILDALDNLVKE